MSVAIGRINYTRIKLIQVPNLFDIFTGYTGIQNIKRVELVVLKSSISCEISVMAVKARAGKDMRGILSNNLSPFKLKVTSFGV